MHRTLPAILIASLALTTGCGAAPSVDKAGQRTGTPRVLTLANHEQGPVDVQAWAAAAERLSGGTLRIRVVNNWRKDDPAYDRGTLGDVRSGRVAMAKIAARAYDTAGVTSLQPLVAPFLIDSESLQTRVLGSEIARRALAGTDRLGLVGLAILPGGLRRAVGVTQAMREPADFRGMRIAVRERQVTAATFRALGATPVALPAGAPLSSVDGAELSFDLLNDNPDVTQVRALMTDVVLWPKPLTVVINGDTFASLTPNQQRALREAGSASLATLAKESSELEGDAARALCRLGVPFLHARPAQLRALRAAVQPVYRTIEDGAGNAAAIREIETMKRGATSDAPRCDSTTRAAAQDAAHSTTIDGTYRTSFSKQELASSPSLEDSGEINDRNWGELTLRLDRGRMRITGQNRHTRGSATGHYTIAGDAIRFELDRTGERFALRWTLYRDTLQFRRDAKLGIGPTPFLVKPWQRVG